MYTMGRPPLLVSLPRFGALLLVAFICIALPSPTSSNDNTTAAPTYTRCPSYGKDSDISDRILILPKHQEKLSDTAKGIIYFFLMLYFFLGISIASHIFMCAIEIIVGKTKTVNVMKIEDGIKVTEKKQVPVWNETIANLTLMALGSSAPEILLSIIETIGNKFCSGALGPGTIVGSASYNLLIITAVCIVSVPGEETRRIKEYKVFLTTSAFAIAAYIWMVVTLQVFSQNYVEIWEALITLAMFPITLGVAYWAEMDFCIKGRKPKRSSIASTIHDPSIPELTEAEAAQPMFHFYDEWDQLVDENGLLNMEVVKGLYKALQEISVLTDEEIATILATKLIQSRGHSLLWYKIRAIQALTAGFKTVPALTDKLKEVMDVLNDVKRTETGRRGELRPIVTSPDTFKKKAVIEFTATCMAIPGFVGTFTVLVKRSGREDVTVLAKVESFDGTAKHDESYTAVKKDIVFEPYVVEQKVTVNVVADLHKNKDSNFFLKLFMRKETHSDQAVLGPMSVMEVVIMDVEQPGEVTFIKKGMVVKDTLMFADIEVERENGADGLLTAKWKVKPGPKCTRVGPDVEGTIQFEHGEVKKILEIPLNPGEGGRAAGQDEQFDVEFVEIAGGGGKLGKNPLITVAVSADDAFQLQVTRVVDMAMDKADSEQLIPRQTYVQQIKSAYIVNGAPEEAKRASTMDVISHYISLPWKMLFCFLPTPYALGGWPCFVLTLFVIGILTAIVGDMATIFGDVLSLDPVTTAITFVALGTSLPDTFASRIAAIHDKTADAAIGNITGSNCVNVFLGLGLPWTIATIYVKIQHPGQELEVNAKSLAFIVTIYTFTNIIAQIILWLRRSSLGFGFAELGGPIGTRWLTSAFLILCWLFYVSFAIMETQQVVGLHKISAGLADALKYS